MKRWLAVHALALLGALPAVHGAETGAVPRISASMISNQVAAIDGFVKDGRMDAYGDLLAPDLVVMAGVAAGVVPGTEAETEELNRDQYLKSLRDMLVDARVTAHTSNITALDISPDGQRCTADLVTFQKYVEKQGPGEVSMAATVKATLALRDGLLLVTRIEFTVTDLVMR